MDGNLQVIWKGMDVSVAMFTRPVWLFWVFHGNTNDIRKLDLGNPTKEPLSELKYF